MGPANAWLRDRTLRSDRTIEPSSRISESLKYFLEKCIDSTFALHVSSVLMTREQATRKREKLAAPLSSASDVLRGSLLQRTLHHSSGCAKCARGEGHPLWVLTVGYPGGKNRQVSLRPEQVPQVRKALQNYRNIKQRLEAISELNQFLLRLDREESKQQELQP
jgi:hypothetical protein